MRPIEQVLDRLQKLTLGNRLGDEAVRDLFPTTIQDVVQDDRAAQHNHGDVALCTDASQEVVAIHTWHHHVKDCQVGMEQPQRLQALATTQRRAHLVAMGSQDVTQ
ncbi:MAG: hypothetical protein A2491_05780 [Bacteroidetes bacterium RIFOXYC12_FULL_35_7]|nr:MAG: hypothetical protein A2491_05780 [Bacteroidetes bacterium RIFOXYC12_FULL_35_7]